jgi:hypothetical protein
MKIYRILFPKSCFEIVECLENGGVVCCRRIPSTGSR